MVSDFNTHYLRHYFAIRLINANWLCLRFLAVFVISLGCSIASAGERNVVIFADFACTDNAAGDPDDCLAVEALRRTPSVTIVAVMTTGGNTHSQLTYDLGRAMFPKMTIFPGTRPRSNRITKAHHQLAALISKQKSNLTFLVLSPATDFAKLIRTAPETLNMANEVIFVAGRTPGDTFQLHTGGRKLRDLNYEKDRSAYADLLPMLFAQRVKTTFVGFRAGMNTQVPREFMPADFVAKAQVTWAQKCQIWFGGKMPPFDVVASMAVTQHKRLLSCQKVKVTAGHDLKLESISGSNFQFCQ